MGTQSTGTVPHSLDHEIVSDSPKTGVRAPEGERTPVFGYPLDFREVLIFYLPIGWI
jgi:hypothetical protein